MAVIYICMVVVYRRGNVWSLYMGEVSVVSLYRRGSRLYGGYVYRVVVYKSGSRL